MDIAPCKDCKKRVVGCHSTCKEYLAWKAENDGINRQKRIEASDRAYAIENALRLKKNRNRRK